MAEDERSSSARWVEVRRWAILVVASLVTTLLVTDYARIPAGTVVEGDVAARTVKAPFSFSYQDMAAWEQQRRLASEASPPVYLWDEAHITEAVVQIDAAFEAGRSALPEPVPDEDADEAPPEVPGPPEPAEREAALDAFIGALGVPVDRDELRPLAEARFPERAEVLSTAWLEDAYGDLLVPAAGTPLPEGPASLRVVPRIEDVPPFTLRDEERLSEPDALRDAITLSALKEKRRASWTDAAAAVASAMVRPTLVFDAERTEAARQDAAAAVSPEPVVMKRGEILFREGDRLTALDVTRYEALQRSRTEHGVALEVAASTGLILLVLGTLYLSIRASLREPEGTRDVASMGGILVIVAGLTRLVVEASHGVASALGGDLQPESVWYAAPVAGGVMLARILMGPSAASRITLPLVTVCALLMRLEALYVVYFFLTALVAARSVRRMRERMTVLRAGLFTGGFGALTVLILHFVELYAGTGELSMATTIRPLWSMAFALLGGLLSAVLVFPLIPLFETAGYVTDHRMLELASLNHPLMRQLMLRAPGTYHHSVVVGTLAEAACDSIGANGLEAKISAYFHDIGKARKPRYFVENQRGGTNPHGSLDPRTSAEVIIKHVTDGARMAREHRLPKPILDNILMHHGTGLLQYFFAKAQMQADDPSEVDEDAFRYPGPKPNTREAGVVMLADKVEAATRTIQKPNEDNIRAMIHRIINSVIADQQFTDCPLTFKELDTIAETFVKVLLGIYHQRIEYPDTQGISRAVEGDGEQGSIAGRPGTITLELESRALAPEPGLWAEDDMTDETTDYESVRNLPHGEP